MIPEARSTSTDSSFNLSFQTSRLSFMRLCLADTLALHELRTEPEVMKWSIQKIPDASLQQTEDWIRATITDTYPFTSSSDREYEEEGSPVMDQTESKSQSNTKSRSKKKWFCFAVRELAYIQSLENKECPRQDRIVGIVGIKEAESPITKRPQHELGYMFVPGVWGKGYASEAVKGIVRWWFGYLDSLNLSGLEYSRGDGEKEDGGEGEVVDNERVYAIISKRNGASRRVLEKCEFRVVGGRRENYDVGRSDGEELIEFCISRADVTM
ncbi:GNAT family N-acetyltransferase [Aspergillus foveolatus]|uniref:GNAT family N-acetyltransferase n=1 Tax=Aspergillus foveolatus TaxID=210207 RepID=UPI003CCDCA64